MMTDTDTTSPQVHVDLKYLMRFEHQAARFSLLPRQPVRSVLAGQHASKLRGRGLNFLEMRVYQPGDDIRAIDWKVTARTQKAFSRVFTEERERPTLLVVDQRRTMFFGSVLNMKSTTAAEIAAMAVWRVLAAKDRVGAVVFDDREIRVIPPQRSRAAGTQILQAIVVMNQRLSWSSGQPAGPEMLNRALERTLRMVTHDYLILQITDGAGRDERTRQLNSMLSTHNDLVLVHVFDPLELDLPSRNGLVIGDGVRQMELSASAAERRQFKEAHETLLGETRRYWRARQAPVLPVSAAEPTGAQLRRLLTIGQPRGRS